MHSVVNVPKKLTAQRALQLFKIFENKNWSFVNELDIDEYDNFCKMLEYLEEDQQDLIISLTEDFLYISSNEYPKHFQLAFDKFYQSEIWMPRGRIYIVPLLREEDYEKNKSSKNLHYLVKSRKTYFQKRYELLKLGFLDLLPHITSPEIIFDRQNDFLCLIDDFIGTGETAASAIETVERLGIPKSRLIVISLVAQKEGLDKIKPNVAATFVANEREKAIRGSAKDEIEKARIMQEIESKMKVKEKYRFGYGQSEALVRMIRTPNNTFPVYWFAKKNGIPIVPFPRD